MSCRSFYEKVLANQPVNLPDKTSAKITYTEQAHGDVWEPVNGKYAVNRYYNPWYIAVIETRSTAYPGFIDQKIFKCSELFDIN